MDNKGVPESGGSGQTMRGFEGRTKLFNRFSLQKVLGRGALGVVWLARDDRLDQLVALKLIPETLSFDPSIREDLKREARKSLQLTHPNIVRIYDFIEDPETAAISMEYVDGLTLSAFQVQKRARCFAVSEMAPWVTSLCDALAYAHDFARVIHRDIKPPNLMVNSRLELKVTDFGIACTIRDSKVLVSARTFSTLNYMSPQQVMDEAPSPSDDIYAVGATLYELFSSKPPFFNGDVATQIREVVPPWIAERREQLGIAGEAVPKHWEEAIAACLEKNPAHRPRDAADLARRLRLGGTIRLTAAQQESKMRGLMESLSRARLLGAAAGIVALIAAIVFGLRAPHHENVAIKREVNLALPAGYTLQLRKKESPPTPPPGALEQRDVSTSAAAPAPTAPDVNPPEVKNADVTLTTAPADADDRTEVSLDPGETLAVEDVFPHGSVSITSTPAGAEIFFGNHSLGKTPLLIDLPLGPQQLTARYPRRPDRTQTVTIEESAGAAVAFQMSEQSHPQSRRKTRTPESAADKIGRTLKKFFSPKPTPKPKR